MSCAVDWDEDTQRFRGYRVPTVCEQPECNVDIDRGLYFACEGCGRFFCDIHLFIVGYGADYALCQCDRCAVGKPPYPLKPETTAWLEHVLTDESWEPWRTENPEKVKTYWKELDELRTSRQQDC